MTLVWRPGFMFDADASTYIEAVEAADTQALETGVRYAINNFVIGCKQDGIWDAIKASCILAGARTLDGALVPLVGTAPTRFGTAGGWNYNREAGLVSNASNNYIDSNRSVSSDPVGNSHISVFPTSIPTVSAGRVMIGAYSGVFPEIVACSQGSSFATTMYGLAAGNNSTPNALIGGSNTAANLIARFANTSVSVTGTLTGSFSLNHYIFARNEAGSPGLSSNARLAFYSIGESLDLALLDARVTDLINAFGVAIP